MFEDRFKISFTCKFRSTHKAISNDITLQVGQPVQGQMITEGSWKDSLKVYFFTIGPLTIWILKPFRTKNQQLRNCNLYLNNKTQPVFVL